jgi:hypothetical protein
VEHLPETAVTRLGHKGDRLLIKLAGRHKGKVEVDRVIANVGYRPDMRTCRELQVHSCYASEGPMKLAAALAGAAGGDCLNQTSQGAATLVNPEPNYYVLGAKSYGRDSRFLISVGLGQIREVFSLLVGRANLDLYATAGTQAR